MGTPPPQLIAGLDVGSRTITILVVAREADGLPRYVEALRLPSAGMRAGVVVSLGELSESIERAIFEVEERVGRRITSVCVGVGGAHLAGQNLRGVATITPLGREIASEDVARAIASARSGLHLEENRELLHVIPRAYMVDEQVGVQDPRGMAAHELEVEVHYTTAAATTLQNLLKCVRQARLVPELAVAAPLAAGEAVREAYDSADCLAVADVGAETTNLAVYVAGSIWLTDVLPVGGDAVTRAIGTQLKLPFAAAEDLKLGYGDCDSAHADEFALVELPPSAGVEALLPRSELVRIIQECAQSLADALGRRFTEMSRAGVTPDVLALTGGGADLAGLDTLLMHALDLPVHRAVPQGIRGLPPVVESPAYATAAGLALWHARSLERESEGAQRRTGTLPGFMTGMRRVLRTLAP